MLFSEQLVTLLPDNKTYLSINNSIMQKLQRISAREAYAAYMRGHLLVDVRDADAIATKTVDVDHLVVLPYSELDQRFSELPTDRPIVLVSRVGNRSNSAAHFLIDHGYSDVAILEGGITEWENEGLPVRHSA